MPSPVQSPSTANIARFMHVETLSDADMDSIAAVLDTLEPSRRDAVTQSLVALKGPAQGTDVTEIIRALDRCGSARDLQRVAELVAPMCGDESTLYGWDIAQMVDQVRVLSNEARLLAQVLLRRDRDDIWFEARDAIPCQALRAGLADVDALPLATQRSLLALLREYRGNPNYRRNHCPDAAWHVSEKKALLQMTAWLRPRSEGAQKVALDVARAARAARDDMPLHIIADYIDALGQHHEDRWQAAHEEFSAVSRALRSSYDRPATLAALAPVSPRRWPDLLAGIEDLGSDSERALFALRAEARTPEDKALLQRVLPLTHGLGVRASRDALLVFTPPQRDNLLDVLTIACKRGASPGIIEQVADALRAGARFWQEASSPS